MDESQEKRRVLKVIGVGGLGCAVVDCLADRAGESLHFAAVDTDRDRLDRCRAEERLLLGESEARRDDLEWSRKAAMEDRRALSDLLFGVDMVVVVAGAGGGTGAGVTPVLCELSQRENILTVAVVTTPFRFEGSRKRERAETCVEELKDRTDSYVVLPSGRLGESGGNRRGGELLLHTLEALAEVFVATQGEAVIPLDFADLRYVLEKGGRAYVGTGAGCGEQKAAEAAQEALASPELNTSLRGAESCLVLLTGDPDLRLDAVEDAAGAVQNAADPCAVLLFCAAADENMADEMRLSVIATRVSRQTEETADTEGEPELSGDNGWADIEVLFREAEERKHRS